jgi:hypothetical protein
MQDTLVITPIKSLVNLDALVDATVQAKPFDDPAFKDEMHIGTIDEVKLNKSGTWVHFHTAALVGKKWIRLNRVVGFAHFVENVKATA